MLQKSTDPLLSIYEQLLEPQREKIAFAVAAIVFGMETVRLLPWKVNARFRQLTNSLNELCRPMIQEKRGAIIKNGDDHFDIVSLLIMSNNFSAGYTRDDGICNHLACYLLATHQEMQHKLRKEVLKALHSESPLGASDLEDIAGTLKQLPYLNGNINETLRLYPTVPVTLRQAIHDTHIAEHPISKGTVLCFIHLANQSFH
uniref:Cytochrome P450 n=1 Tax=Bionectria ochroleuca TaxID=29856 RepID=A0A0B7K8Q9_BIOOC